MKDHKDCIRGYIRSHKTWYASTNNIIYPEIILGMYEIDGSTSGEMEIKWRFVGKNLCAQLCCYEDSWSALSLFTDLIQKMGEVDSKNIQEEEFIKILDSCGFKDMTQYNR